MSKSYYGVCVANLALGFVLFGPISGVRGDYYPAWKLPTHSEQALALVS
jgi:hypothetical protein